MITLRYGDEMKHAHWATGFVIHAALSVAAISNGKAAVFELLSCLQLWAVVGAIWGLTVHFVVNGIVSRDHKFILYGVEAGCCLGVADFFWLNVSATWLFMGFVFVSCGISCAAALAGFVLHKGR